MKLANTLIKLIPLALGSMAMVEKLFATRKGTSADKKEAYIEALMTALGITESVANQDMVNDDKFKRLLGKFADTVIEINNFIRDYKHV